LRKRNGNVHVLLRSAALPGQPTTSPTLGSILSPSFSPVDRFVLTDPRDGVHLSDRSRRGQNDLIGMPSILEANAGRTEHAAESDIGIAQRDGFPSKRDPIRIGKVRVVGRSESFTRMLESENGDSLPEDMCENSLSRKDSCSSSVGSGGSFGMPSILEGSAGEYLDEGRKRKESAGADFISPLPVMDAWDAAADALRAAVPECNRRRGPIRIGRIRVVGRSESFSSTMEGPLVEEEIETTIPHEVDYAQLEARPPQSCPFPQVDEIMQEEDYRTPIHGNSAVPSHLQERNGEESRRRLLLPKLSSNGSVSSPLLMDSTTLNLHEAVVIENFDLSHRDLEGERDEEMDDNENNIASFLQLGVLRDVTAHPTSEKENALEQEQKDDPPVRNGTIPSAEFFSTTMKQLPEKFYQLSLDQDKKDILVPNIHSTQIQETAARGKRRPLSLAQRGGGT